MLVSVIVIVYNIFSPNLLKVTHTVLDDVAVIATVLTNDTWSAQNNMQLQRFIQMKLRKYVVIPSYDDAGTLTPVIPALVRPACQDLIAFSQRGRRPAYFQHQRRYIPFVFTRCKVINFSNVKGKARTQSPTIRNYAPELPPFGVIAGVSPTEVQ